MKSIVRKALSAALIVVGLAVASNAQAVLVTYTVDGMSQQFPGPLTPPSTAPWGASGYPGDTVALQNYSGTLDLTPGTTTQKINTLLWTIDYTYGGTPEPWPDMNFSQMFARSISFGGGPVGVLSQGVNLTVNYDNDYLGLDAGSTVTFYVQGFRVDVTPEGVATAGGSNFDGGNPWAQPAQDVYARFDVTPAAVPEPATMVSGALLLLPFGASALRKLRKKVSP